MMKESEENKQIIQMQQHFEGRNLRTWSI